MAKGGNGKNPLSFDPDRTFDVELKHPRTGDLIRGPDGRVATITIAGPDSAEAHEFERQLASRRLDDVWKRGKRRTPDPDDRARENAEMLCAITKRWYIPSLNGAAGEFAFTRENALDLYTDRGSAWARRLVEEAFNDASNFFGD